MAKIHTTLSIDDEVLKKTKESQINISQEVEEHLRQRLGQKTIIPSDEDECAFCGKMERKATIDDINGLTWLYPDEVWMCHKCFINETQKKIIGVIPT